jgi:eukaryotic-like serine/threonine-protein kinase
MQDFRKPAPPPASDETLDPVEDLLAACLAEAPAQVAAAVERAAAEHPQLAVELRERYGLLVSVGLGSGAHAPPEFPEQLGDFRLVRRLGGGGMGVVYLAEQVALRRHVALKLIRPELSYFPGSRERFRRETDAIARLQHPGIVPIYTVGEIDGLPFYAMELIQGATLADVLESVAGRAPEGLRGADIGRCAAQRVRAIGLEVEAQPGEGAFPGGWVEACALLAAQIARALEYVHARGLVHRDVKPSNVAVTLDGRALLFDFGLTSVPAGDRVTRSGAAIGTPAYMAPEQLRGQSDVGPRADVYSLGATLYELLTLQVPYRASTPLALHAALATGRPDSIRARNRRVGDDLETVCRKALDPDPRRRYASALDFAHDLENVLAHRPIAARPPSWARRATQWARRRPATAVSLLLGGLLAFGTPAALAVQARRHARAVEATLVERDVALERAQAAHREAAQERDRAQRETRTVSRSLRFVQDLFAAAAPSVNAGKSVSAREIMDRGAERLKTELGEEPEVKGRILLTIGRVYEELECSQEAIAALELAEALYREAASPGAELALSSVRISKALAYLRLARFDECEQLLTAVVAGLRAAPAPDADNLSSALSAQGMLAFRRERWHESESLHREALAIAAATPEVTALDVEMLRVNLGGVLLRTDRLEEARRELESGVAALRRLVSPPHPILVQAINNLAQVEKKLGHLDAAAALYAETMAMTRTLFGEDGTTYATLLVNVAGLEEARGEWAAAEAKLRAAVRIFDAKLDAADPNRVYAYGNLAGVLWRSGRWSAAQELYGVVLPLQERVLGERHPATGHSHWGIAQCKKMAGDDAGAEAALRRCALILREHRGHEATVVQARGLAALERHRAGDSARCEDELEETLEYADETLGPRHPATRRLLETIATFYELSARHEMARPYRERLKP